jgi:hypothetical protein
MVHVYASGIEASVLERVKHRFGDRVERRVVATGMEPVKYVRPVRPEEASGLVARRILSHLDGHPVRTIFLLRLLLWMAPQLNYALALSNVRFRSYLLGTALGLLAPIAGLVLLSDRFLR